MIPFRHTSKISSIVSDFSMHWSNMHILSDLSICELSLWLETGSQLCDLPWIIPFFAFNPQQNTHTYYWPPIYPLQTHLRFISIYTHFQLKVCTQMSKILTSGRPKWAWYVESMLICPPYGPGAHAKLLVWY